MRQEKVLLVDDEKDFVEALSERLKVRDVAVEVAHNGVVALEKAQQQHFDVVVLDLAMPGMDGIETLRALRNVNPEIQVVLLTGRATVATGVEAMKLGAMDFLEKPVELDLLLDKIHQGKAKSDEVNEEHTKEVLENIIRTKGW